MKRVPREGWIRRSVLLAATICLLASVTVQTQSAEQQQRVGLDAMLKKFAFAAMPLKKTDGSGLALDAQLNNGKTILMLIDTGCGRTTLHHEKAKGLKTLGEMGVTLQDTAFGEHTNQDIVVIEKLTLGKADFFNQPAEAMKLEFVGKRPNFDGFLGWDFFVRNHAIIDCGTQTLYCRGEEPSAEQAKALSESFLRSSFVQVALHHIDLHSVPVTLQGNRLSMLVDTGAEFTQLHEWVAKELKLKPVKRLGYESGNLVQYEVQTLSVGVGDIGIHGTRFTEVASFELGPRKWGKTLMGVTDLRAWGVRNSLEYSERIQGFLGIDILAQNGALIDFNTKCLWLRPESWTKAPRAAEPHRRTGKAGSTRRSSQQRSPIAND